HFLILLLQNKFVKTHLHHSLCTRNGEGSNRGFYEGFFKTLYNNISCYTTSDLRFYDNLNN
ncbi:MAG: hypothetical protein MUO82_04250, partial [Candidatus Thermoplasmatota archaeon]|nr:hypothetical protein [Candidatus Thermoplasmatota archaeon]